MKKLVLIIAGLLLLVSVVPAGIGCSNDNTVKWTVAAYCMPSDVRTEILQNFADKVKEKSNGKMEIRVTTAGELFQGGEIFDQVSLGNLQIGLPSLDYHEQMPKFVTTVSMPWGNSVGERMRYFNAAIEYDPVKQELEDHNIMNLMWISTGWLEFYFTNLVTGAAGFANKQLVSPGGAVDGLVAALGAIPVHKDVSEIVQAVQGGTVNGIAVMPFDDYYKNQLYSLLPYVLMTRTLEYPFPCIMNRDAFNGLDKDLQQIVLDAALEAQTEGLTTVTEEVENAYNDIADNNFATITELTDEARAGFKGMELGVFQSGLSVVFSEAEVAQIMAIVQTVADQIAGRK